MSTSKDNIFNIFEMVLWFIFAICSICVYISTFQLFKDTYFYVAASSLIGITLIVRRAKIFTWYTFISGLIYAGCILNYFLTHLFCFVKKHRLSIIMINIESQIDKECTKQKCTYQHKPEQYF